MLHSATTRCLHGPLGVWWYPGPCRLRGLESMSLAANIEELVTSQLSKVVEAFTLQGIRMPGRGRQQPPPHAVPHRAPGSTSDHQTRLIWLLQVHEDIISYRVLHNLSYIDSIVLVYMNITSY